MIAHSTGAFPAGECKHPEKPSDDHDREGGRSLKRSVSVASSFPATQALLDTDDGVFEEMPQDAQTPYSEPGYSKMLEEEIVDEPEEPSAKKPRTLSFDDPKPEGPPTAKPEESHGVCPDAKQPKDAIYWKLFSCNDICCCMSLHTWIGPVHPSTWDFCT